MVIKQSHSTKIDDFHIFPWFNCTDTRHSIKIDDVVVALHEISLSGAVGASQT